MTQLINENVNVTAVRFRQDLETVPHRIEYGGRSYTFVDSGMRYLIRRGEHMVRLLDMSDGHSKFRLRYDDELSGWKLLSIAR